MLKYTMQRILAMALTLFIIITLGFMVIRLMPGGMYDDEYEMTQSQRDALTAKYNLDKPIPVQYFLFLKGLVTQGDWGTSLKLSINVPVWNVIKDKIPITLYINFFSLLISLPLGMLFGILAALRKNSLLDYAVSLAVVLCISIPSFVFATLLQYFIAFKGGMFSIIYNAKATGLSRFSSLFLPILALSFSPIARVTRYLRAELSETINSDFMLLARTKGLSRAQATVRHAMKNAMVPILPMLISSFIGILGGSMIIEQIFSIPGVGQLYIKSIRLFDYDVFMMDGIFYTFIGLLAGIVVDISYGFIDPRIRMGEK